jgi:hypothetical protein
VFVDPELREFAQSGGARKCSVILETITNPVLAPSRFKARGELRKRVGPSKVVDEAAAFEALARELLRFELTDQPVQLKGLRSFVVELTPEQLRRVLELPMISAVRVNRTHRTPRL